MKNCEPTHCEESLLGVLGESLMPFQYFIEGENVDNKTSGLWIEKNSINDD